MARRPRRLSALVALAAGLSLPGVVTLVALDARARRSERAAEQPRIDEIARRLPSSDLALSGGARWLRGLSLEEPGAAFSEGPAVPDLDPADGVVSPPRGAWAVQHPRGK